MIRSYPAISAYRYVKKYINEWRYYNLLEAHGLVVYAESDSEKLYREVLASKLYDSVRAANAWLPGDLLPVGGAVDYKVLYLLARTLAEHSFQDAIEFGAGQTTHLLSAYASQSGARVLTVEHDKAWADRVSQSISAPSHTLHHAELASFQSKQAGTYSWYSSIPPRQYELFVIDGPVGTKSYSRVGIVDRFFDICANEWLVVWDDLHRYGDMQSFALFHDHIKGRGKTKVIDGLKRFGIAYTEKYSAVSHYF